MKMYNKYEFGPILNRENEYEIVKWDNQFEDTETIITFKLNEKNEWYIDYINIKFFDNYENGLVDFVKQCLTTLRLGDKYTQWISDDNGEYRCSCCGVRAPYDVGVGDQICPKFCYNCGKEAKSN